MKNPPNNKLFLQCSCSCSVLVVEKFPEDKEYYISLFKGKHGFKLCWRERFRWIKEILLTGNIWTDNVVLEEKDVKELSKFLK